MNRAPATHTWFSARPLILLSLLAGRCWSAQIALPLNLDFGTAASPVYDTHSRVGVDSVFDGRFGWVSPPMLEERDRGGEQSTDLDFIFSTEPAVFRIALPDGDYVVTMTCHDSASSHSPFAIRADDKTGYEIPDTTHLESLTVVLLGKASKGFMDIELNPITSLWWINALTVRAREPDEKVIAAVATQGGKTIQLAEHPFDVVRESRLSVIKKPVYDTATYPSQADYMRVLERFPLFAERGWHPKYNDLADVGYFGDGTHDEMGLRSMGNFIFTCALLASDPAYDSKTTGVGQEQVLEYAKQCLRYMTRSHVTGDLTCADGGKWGNQWQSSWWTGKMAAGARLIWEKLSPEERAAVERVVVHEANRHLARLAPGGASSDTKSEENAWDTEALTAALGLFPEHENTPKWWRKLQDFAMNTLSAPQDKQDSTLVDHRPVKDWVYTTNIHSDYTIENHGAYHFCYMACPLHSLAWGWYNLTSNGQPVPKALFHHYRDVYDVIDKTFLYDGRFAYISGKDWPRYAYGLSFILPANVLMQKVFGDANARLFEKERFQTLEREQIMNADGTFYGRRFTKNRMLSRPLEYETDTYANLGVCYLMHKMDAKPPISPTDPEEYQRGAAGTFISAESGWLLGRSPKVFTSFSWRDLGGKNPMGIFVPKGCDDMAEWGRDQLAGSTSIVGSEPRKRQVTHNDQVFDGGFWTVGQVTHAGGDGAPMMNQHLAFVSLPEEGLALVVDHAVAVKDITVTVQEGLKYYLANDIFNGGTREVTSPSGKFKLWGANTNEPPPDKANHVVGEPWLCVDGKLSFVALTSNSPFTVRDIRGRQAQWGSIEYEMINLPYITEPRDFHSNGLVRYTAVVLCAGNARDAARVSAQSKLISSGSSDIRCAVLSRNAKAKWLAAINFGDKTERVNIDIDGQTMTFDVKAMSAEIRRLDH